MENDLIRKLWMQFEKLSTEIVVNSLKLEKHKLTYSTSETKLTRDQGVDGYIFIEADEKDFVISIEAKFRRHSKLSLRDIASSLVYFLINEEVESHYVVTNSTFTSENVRVVHEIRNTQIKCIELIDGNTVREIMSLNPILGSRFPDISKYIHETNIEPSDSMNTLNTKHALFKKLNTTIISFKERINQLAPLYLECQEQLTLIIGKSGVGKSCYIDSFIDYQNTSKYMRCDLKGITSSRYAFLMIISELINFDFYGMLLELSDIDKRNIHGLLTKNNDVNVSRSDIIQSINAIFQLDSSIVEAEYHYIVFLKNLLDKVMSSSGIVLIFENLDRTSEDVIQFLSVFINAIEGSNISLVIELNSNFITEYRNFSDSYWHHQIQVFKNIKYGDCRPILIELSNFTHEETQKFLSHRIPGISEKRINEIIERFGTNPYMLNQLSLLFFDSNYNLESLSTVAGEAMGLVDDRINIILNRLIETKKQHFLNIISAVSVFGGEIEIGFLEKMNNHYSSYNLNEINDIIEHADIFKLHQHSLSFNHLNTYDHVKTMIFTRYPQVVQRFSESFLNLFIDDKYTYLKYADKIIELQCYANDSNYVQSLLMYVSDNSNKVLVLKAIEQYLSNSQFHDEPIHEDLIYLQLSVEYLISAYHHKKQNDPLIVNLIKNLEKSIHYNRLFNIFPSEAFTLVKLDFYLYMLQTHYDRFEYSKALDYLSHAKSVALLNTSTEVINKMIEILRIESLIIKRTEGKEACVENLRLKSLKYPNTLLEVSYYAHLGGYTSFNDYDKGIEYLLKGLRICEDQNFHYFKSWLRTDIGMYSIYNKKFVDAYILCQENINFAKRNGFYSDVVRNSNYLGCLEFFNGKLEKSREWFENGIHYARMIGSYQEFFIITVNYLNLISPQTPELVVELVDYLSSSIDELTKSLRMNRSDITDKNYVAYHVFMRYLGRNNQGFFKKMNRESNIKYDSKFVNDLSEVYKHGHYIFVLR